MIPSSSFARSAFLPGVLIVFTASGFAGLIYESIWSHYLKLFLGHAAYAQSLVLAIFMGGMALGAWAASRISPRLRDCLRAYALVEAVIGLASLAFHDVFVASTALAFDRIIPALGSPVAIQAFKWSLGAALLLPQSILLGATFPLMTGGVLRLRPERAGYVIAMLYFTNSLGAAVGVLVSGFYLIEAASLPGALAAAGAINLAVAAAVMLLRPSPSAAPAPAGAAAPAASVPRLRLMLAVAALTGASSFFYEIGWIRMLSLVLGSSTHAFELMLSAFILGIACGGVAIRRRIDASAEPMRLLGWVQLAMGLAALATLPVYGSTFVVMEAALRALSPSAGGYVAFNVVSHGICLAVMFPAAFCAGMTLPLITAALLRNGAGERAVGQVYAANTAGSIVGVILAVHAGFTLLGLKGMIVFGAAVDLGLGVLLLASAPGGQRRLYASATGALALVAIVGTLAGVQLDAERMASGVYRTGSLGRTDSLRSLLQIDGKTVTVSVKDVSGVMALLSNGKSEGSVRVRGDGSPMADEALMTIVGALPQFLKPEARQVANIGFGTGMTTHVLLASTAIESLDTVEIEPAVVRVADRFRPFNARALDDPRSHIRYDDAKTYFSARQQRYDVIVSEPSNPWVSGVSGLFTTEFYAQVRRYLRDDGLFVQWVHVYEMSPVLVATIMGALAENFPDFELWMANHGDMVVVAVNKGRLPPLDPRAFANPRLRADLARLNIRNLDDLLVHRVGGRAALGPYYGSFGAPVNSDFAPVLDLNATYARFLRRQLDDVPLLLEAGIPVLPLFDRPRRAQPDPSRFSEGPHLWLHRAEQAREADAVRRYLRSGDATTTERLPPLLAANVTLLRGALVECRLGLSPVALRRALGATAELVNSHLSSADRQSVWKQLSSSPCSARLPSGSRAWLALHAAVAAQDGKQVARAAEALLTNEENLASEDTPYLVAAHMSGLLLQGDSLGAMRSFQRHRGRLAGGPQWEPVFRFLVGQATGG